MRLELIRPENDDVKRSRNANASTLLSTWNDENENEFGSMLFWNDLGTIFFARLRLHHLMGKYQIFPWVLSCSLNFYSIFLLSNLRLGKKTTRERRLGKSVSIVHPFLSFQLWFSSRTKLLTSESLTTWTMWSPTFGSIPSANDFHFSRHGKIRDFSRLPFLSCSRARKLFVSFFTCFRIYLIIVC